MTSVIETNVIKTSVIEKIDLVPNNKSENGS